MIPGLGSSPGEGKGYPLQYWVENTDLENSMDCIVHGVTKSQTRLSDFQFHFTKASCTQELYSMENGLENFVFCLCVNSSPLLSLIPLTKKSCTFKHLTQTQAQTLLLHPEFPKQNTKWKKMNNQKAFTKPEICFPCKKT